MGVIRTHGMPLQIGNAHYTKQKARFRVPFVCGFCRVGKSVALPTRFIITRNIQWTHPSRQKSV